MNFLQMPMAAATAAANATACAADVCGTNHANVCGDHYMPGPCAIEAYACAVEGPATACAADYCGAGDCGGQSYGPGGPCAANVCGADCSGGDYNPTPAPDAGGCTLDFFGFNLFPW